MPLGEAGKGFASLIITQHLCIHFPFPFLRPAARWLQWAWLYLLKLTGQTSSCHEPRESLELLTHSFPKEKQSFPEQQESLPCFLPGQPEVGVAI